MSHIIGKGRYARETYPDGPATRGGARGATGATGSTGSTGGTGSTGATGSAGGAAAYFWQTVADVTGTIAANNGKALFHTPSSNNVLNITTVADSGDINMGVGSAGTYKITWSLSAAEPGAMAVFINGAKAAGSVYGSGAGTQQNNGQTLLLLSDGDVVSLRTDNCPAALTLQLAGTTDTAMIVASILLEKI